MFNRNFEIKGIEFCIANYTPRQSLIEYEKGLKYQLLIKVYDGYCINNGKVEKAYKYHATGYKSHTMKDCKEYAKKNYYVYM